MSITTAEIAAAIRVGSTTAETAEVERLRTYAIEAISHYLGAAYADAPESVVNEATVRLVGYLYDIPTVSRGDGFANALRFSGAARMLLPYRVHRAGTTGEAVAAAQEAVGTADNPVTDVSVSGSTMTVTFSDGSTRTETLPAAGGPVVDQGARDAATAAQSTADTALSTANANTRPMPATPAEAAGGASTTIRGWTAALIRAAINAVVPAWARTGDNSTLPPEKIADRSLIARMFKANSVDHNALATDSVRRAAVLAEAIDLSKLAAEVRALLLPTGGTDGQIVGRSGGSPAWVAAPAGAAAGRWYDMAQWFNDSATVWTTGSEINMTLRSEGQAVFADAAALRTAIGDGSIPMLAVQESDSDRTVIVPIASNFGGGSQSNNYRTRCYWPDGTGEHVTLRFYTDRVTIAPSYADPGTVRFDLAVYN